MKLAVNTNFFIEERKNNSWSVFQKYLTKFIEINVSDKFYRVFTPNGIKILEKPLENIKPFDELVSSSQNGLILMFKHFDVEHYQRES